MKITYILIDIGYLIYRAISSIFVKKTGLKRINIPTKKLIKIRKKKGRINEIVKIKININRHKQNIYFYIIQDHLEYDLILGKP